MEITWNYFATSHGKGPVDGESEQDCGTFSRCHDAHVRRQLGFSEYSVRRTIDSNALDGSEYFMVSDKLFKIVGAEMLEFREALLETIAPTTVEKLMKTITPPKGVRIRESSDVPPDEGKELFDCEGEEIWATKRCIWNVKKLTSLLERR